MKSLLYKLGLGVALSTLPITITLAQEVAARVGQTDITLDQARTMIEGLPDRDRTVIKTDPTLMAQALRLMLVNQLVLKEAEAKKWDAEPAIKAQIDHAREAIVTESYLGAVAAPPANFPTDSDVQAYYNANAQSLFQPRQFQIAQVFVAVPKTADQGQKDSAAKKLADIQGKLHASNADFAAIAKSDSDARETAERGGELGWVAENTVRPELLAKISGLAKGQVADPVLLDDGWHILKLLDTRPAGPVPLDAIKPQIVAKIREQAAAQLRRNYIARLVEKNPLSVNEFALAKLVSATPAGTNASVKPTAAPTAEPAPERPAPSREETREKKRKN